jgi:LysR family transcriptional regulator, glycine cleavage system transcriptional activator
VSLSVDMRNLPSLSALRAFEAAARLGSFTAAAQELGMSQAAVSYQIKRLEIHVAQTVFRRGGRGVSLTEDGERIARAVNRAFNLIEQGLRRPKGDHSLAVTTTASFANLWLSPQLGNFQDRHPTIDLHVVGENEIRDPADGKYDIAVRTGAGRWEPLVSDKLFDVTFTPMCSPEFLRACGGNIELAQLGELRRIVPQEPWWDIWMSETAAGLHPMTGREIKLDFQTECTAAARAGQGIAILMPAFTRRDMEEGALIAPFEHTSTDGSAYWMTYERGRRSDPKIVAFRRWLLSELKTTVV